MTSLSLEQVEQAFEAWRDTRHNRREKIPQRLWQMVQQLSLNYSQTIICQRLKLSGGQFKRSGTCTERHPVKEPEFVVVQDPMPEANLPSSITLTLQGLQRQLHITVPSESLSQVLPQLESFL